MQMYKVMILPKAEEDISDNTDYIAFVKKVPDTVLRLAMGFRNTIAKLEFMPKQHEIQKGVCLTDGYEGSQKKIAGWN